MADRHSRVAPWQYAGTHGAIIRTDYIAHKALRRAAATVFQANGLAPRLICLTSPIAALGSRRQPVAAPGSQNGAPNSVTGRNPLLRAFSAALRINA